MSSPGHGTQSDCQHDQERRQRQMDSLSPISAHRNGLAGATIRIGVGSGGDQLNRLRPRPERFCKHYNPTGLSFHHPRIIAIQIGKCLNLASRTAKLRDVLETGPPVHGFPERCLPTWECGTGGLGVSCDRWGACVASLEWNLCWETNSELMCNLHSVPETGIADRLRADTTRPEPSAPS